MRVNSVSFVFHLALKKPGMNAQMPPSSAADTPMTISSTGEDILS